MKRLRAWWAQRRYGPLTRDRCERCGQHLREKQRVEVFEAFAFDGEAGIYGGGGIAATFCRKDAPA